MSTNTPGIRARTATEPPSRRYVLGVSAWGLATAAYLGLAGGLPRHLLVGTGILSTVLVSLPVLAVFAIALRIDHNEQGRFERRVAPAYLAGLVGAVALDTIALGHGSLPAILVGLLPAAPCWLDAMRVARSRRRA